MSKIELTLVIPTFNEEEIIERSLIEIASQLGPDLCKSTEVFVVDDGTDNLNNLIPSIAKKLPFYSVEMFRNIPPAGKGASVALAFEHARGEIVGFMDVDLSTPPRYVHKAIETLNSGLADIFIGSRKAAGATVHRQQFFMKDILGHVLAFFGYGIIFVGMRHYQDTQCGFKFFKNRVAKMLYRDLLAHDGLTDLEILLRANLLGMRVFECGVEWTDVRKSKRTLRRIFVGEVLSMARIILNYKILPGRQRKRLEERK